MTKRLKDFSDEDFYILYGSVPYIDKLNQFERFCFYLVRHCIPTEVELKIQDSSVIGTPDILVPMLKLAVFCDGDFWHDNKGRPMTRTAIQFFSRDENEKAEFWYEKSRKNKARDRQVNKELKNLGYKVVRLKEHKINGSDPLAYVSARIGLAFFNQ